MEDMTPSSIFAPPGYPGNPMMAEHNQQLPAFPGIPTQASMLVAVDKLKFFLATAPSRFDQSPYDPNDPVAREERCLNRFQLPTGELISCILWNGLYHVTGTDIVRVLHFRFAAFGRPVRNPKKFEEGIFSDLRNLKSGTDATLEEPKSDFLELLFKYNCIRTQKKQKVFYWFSVPHDRLFLDALDRDLKREKLGVEPTTEAVAEPALSFVYNPAKSLFEQFTEQQSGHDGDSEGHGGEALSNTVNPDSARSDGSEPPGLVVTEPRVDSIDANKGQRKRPFHISTGSMDGMPHGVIQEVDGGQVLLLPSQTGYRSTDTMSSASSAGLSSAPQSAQECHQTSPLGSGNAIASGISGSRSGVARTMNEPQTSAIFGAFTLFEGSPTYKQRRKPGQKRPSPSASSMSQSRRAESTGSRTSVSPMPGQGGYDTDHIQRPTSACAMGGAATAPLHGQHGPSGNYHSGAPAMICPPHSAPVTQSFAASGLTSALSLEVPAPFLLELNTTPTIQDDVHGNPAKIYVCPLFSCGRLFKRLEHLKRHLRIHTEEKPYPCTRCEKRFARSDNLAAHLKIHDKFSARSGSACAAEKAAFDAEDDIDEKSLMVMTENYDSSHALNESPPLLNHPSANSVNGAPYYGYNGRAGTGLPTPPAGRPEQQWGHYGYSHVAPHMLTPDPSPDPSMPGASVGPPSRQMSMEAGHCPPPNVYAHHLADAHRYRSETPTGSLQHHESYDARHPYMNGPRYSSHDAIDDGNSVPNGVSPMMTSFQQQLNMVNSLHEEISNDHHQQQGIGMTGPYYAGAAGMAAGAVDNSIGLGLMRPGMYGGAATNSTSPAHSVGMNGQGVAGPEYHHYSQASLHASMPPPVRPASSYQEHGFADSNYSQHHAQTSVLY